MEDIITPEAGTKVQFQTNVSSEDERFLILRAEVGEHDDEPVNILVLVEAHNKKNTSKELGNILLDYCRREEVDFLAADKELRERFGKMFMRGSSRTFTCKLPKDYVLDIAPINPKYPRGGYTVWCQPEAEQHIARKLAKAAVKLYDSKNNAQDDGEEDDDE